MPKLTVKLPTLNGVAKGGTATLEIPPSRSIEKLLLSYAGVTLAQMTELRLVGNGSIIRRWVGAELIDKMNQFDGLAAASGILTINMIRPGLLTKAGIEQTILGLGVSPTKEYPVTITDLSLEIDIDPAAAAPVLSCKAIQSAPRPLDTVLKIRNFNKSATGQGEFEISDLNHNGELINRIWFISDDINGLRVERDNRIIFERTKTENELIQSDGVRHPQAAMFVYDPTEEGYGAEVLITRGVQDLRFVLDMAGAANIQVVVEYIGRMDRT